MNTEIEYIKNRAQGIARYSDKIREQLIKIDEIMTPAIKEAGIIYTFPEIVMTRNDNYFGTVNYRLSVRKGTTKASGSEQYWGIFLKSDEEVIGSTWVGDASRDALKEAVKYLVPFLTAYSKVLQEKLVEYHDIEQKTERMAQAISS
jgi:hypothetical protein